MTGPEYGPPPGPQYPQNPQFAQNPAYAPGPEYVPNASGAPAPPFGAQPVMPQKSMKKRRTVALVFLLVLVAVIGFFGYKASKSNPDSAAVGDCVSKGSGSAEDVKKVDCTAATAAYKVVGKVEHKTQVDFNVSSQSICGPFAGAKSAFWKGEVGKAGYVLCLAPTK